ncbi:MAG TPA: hypothetical protein VKS60_25095 [Stellaceae bacterium]|nr:hypothetical protein [Stellaceae bacterium]
MTRKNEFFPANYWTETLKFPALQIVPDPYGTEWMVIRCYRNQEDGVSRRILEKSIDLPTARMVLAAFERDLEMELIVDSRRSCLSRGSSH